MNNQPFWYHVSVCADPGVFEALENRFFELGCSGTEEKPGAVSGYFTGSAAFESIRQKIFIYIENLKDLGCQVESPEISIVRNENWGDAWKTHFRPVIVAPDLVVKPPWETVAARKNRIIIDIMPRMAFGTGTHETTRLCLKYLRTHVHRDMRVLDLGTGSGILAITAARLGASHVKAADIDETAVDNTLENITLNGVENRVTVVHGSLNAVSGEAFDIIAANIHRKALETLLPAMHEICRPGARIIASGILNTEAERMQAIIRDSGFIMTSRMSETEWSAFLISQK